MKITPHAYFLTVKDHSVSKEDFKLHYDIHGEMLITTPQPSDQDLPRYYESDDYISHTDSKRSVFEMMYHAVKSFSISRKLKLAEKYNPLGAMLDIGAGTGDFLLAAKKRGWHVSGIEPSEKARSIASSKGIKLEIDAVKFAGNSFDVITMWHVLEHVPDLDRQIAELKHLLKPDGTILIAVPNFRSYDAAFYGEFWAAYDVPRHLWHFSKESISRLFAAKNMEVGVVLPMKFDAYYVSLLSTKYKTGKMRFTGAFATALRSNVKARQTREYSSHIYVIKNKE